MSLFKAKCLVCDETMEAELFMNEACPSCRVKELNNCTGPARDVGKLLDKLPHEYPGSDAETETHEQLRTALAELQADLKNAIEIANDALVQLESVVWYKRKYPQDYADIEKLCEKYKDVVNSSPEEDAAMEGSSGT